MDRPIGDFLAHYGVVGMKWGKGKSVSSIGSSSNTRKKSQDHIDAMDLKKKRLSELSNTELKKLNQRLQLEQSYTQLMSKQNTKMTSGRDFFKKTLSTAKTMQDVYNTVNSPAAKAAKTVIQRALASTL